MDHKRALSPAPLLRQCPTIGHTGNITFMNCSWKNIWNIYKQLVLPQIGARQELISYYIGLLIFRVINKKKAFWSFWQGVNNNDKTSFDLMLMLALVTIIIIDLNYFFEI